MMKIQSDQQALPPGRQSNRQSDFGESGVAMFRFFNLHFEEILGSFLLAVMVSIAFVNVIVRYCTNFSFAWSEEMTINFFVWVTLLGTARAFRNGTNFVMTLCYDVFPRKIRLICYILGCVLCVLFFGALFWTGLIEVMDEYDLESISESLGIPVWWYTMATPLFSLLIIARMIQRSFCDLRSGKY